MTATEQTTTLDDFGLTPDEAASLSDPIAELIARVQKKQSIALFGEKRGDAVHPVTVGNDVLTDFALADVTGSISPAWMNGVANQLAALRGGDGDVRAASMGQGLAFMAGANPSSPLEATVAVQVWALHLMALKLAEPVIAGNHTSGQEANAIEVMRLTGEARADLLRLKGI